MSDPAAAPLGTDSEAAGMGVPEGSLEPPTSRPDGAHPAGHARGAPPSGAEPLVWIFAATGVVVAAGLAALWLAG